jgi:hypothetical protein
MTRGKKMLSYGLLYIGLTAVVLAIIYMFHNNEESRYKDLKGQVGLCVTKSAQLGLRMDVLVTSINATDTTMVDIKNLVVTSAETAKQACEETSRLQEHCAKLRASQINLQDKLSRKRPLLGVSGPIQVEIYTPTKNLGKKKTK